jgi:hypothetical protein
MASIRSSRRSAPYYKQGGRPGIPPAVYFRMVFIGYFEALDSQRGIAWRCADSMVREFQGFPITESTPVHASMTIIRQRLPEAVFDEAFTCAHVCETGGGRRVWVAGTENVQKVHLLRCAAYNLGLLLRKVWGLVKPRNAAERAAALFSPLLGLFGPGLMGFGIVGWLIGVLRLIGIVVGCWPTRATATRGRQRVSPLSCETAFSGSSGILV